jgi:hypothetical protein
MYRIGIGACAVAFLFTADRATAQGTVSATGSAELKRPAEALRVQVELLAKGKDLREALARLRDRRESARKQLAALGADLAAIEIGEATTGGDKGERQQQMEQMMARLQARGGQTAPKPKQAVPVIVTAALKVDLPLKATDPEALLVAATALQEKIRAADLGGLKDAEKPSPQEEELLEEMGLRGGGNPGEPKRGEPVFQFVVRIPAAERDRASAEAFQRAKREASRLAKAAGADLGGLARIGGGPIGMDADVDFDQMRRYAAYGNQPAAGRPLDDGAYEAVGDRPGRVALRVSLIVEFHLAPPGK